MATDSGVFTISELLDLGRSIDEIKRAQRQRTLIPVRHGWVRQASADPGAIAAVTAGGALACVCALKFHRTHGLPGIWIPPGHTGTHVRLSKHAKATARPSGPFHWCQGYGRPLPVTTAVDSIPLALACAARCVSAEEWIAIVDSILNSTAWTVPDLQTDMGVLTNGIRDMFGRCDALSQSGTESVTRLRLRAKRFDVVVQPEVGERHHADLRVGALLIECDGFLYHSDEESYRNDRARDRVTLIDRWMTMRITYDDVFYAWDEVLADVRAITRSDRHRIRRKDDPRRRETPSP